MPPDATRLGNLHLDPPVSRYFWYRPPADLRKGADGLSGLVRGAMVRDPLSGDVFVFVNRLRTLVKVLRWDGTGFVLLSKRLEAGTFPLPLTWGAVRRLTRESVSSLVGYARFCS